MTNGEVLQLFAGMRPARLGPGYAPHKPLVVLLLLEKILNGHENRFTYAELDADLRRLLEKYGSTSASAARNEPFWRLQNDGIVEVTTSVSLLHLSGTPTPAQLIDAHAYARFAPELFQALQTSPTLVRDVAHEISQSFLEPRYQAAIVADAAPSIAKLSRRFWWVSQNRTYQNEIDGNFMWSPKTNVGGGRNPYYDFMPQLVVGDIVFSFRSSQICAIGLVVSAAVPCPKPDFGNRGISWLDDGWLVGVAFQELGGSSIRPSEHMELLTPTLPDRYAPIRKNGVGNEMYLAPVPYSMAEVLTTLIGPVARAIVDEVPSGLEIEVTREQDAAAAEGLEQRTDIGPTQKLQLVMARRGQGLFRANVGQIEHGCRLTKTTTSLHLIASHIKPWSKSGDEERISGYNGLLLAPHADHLFDGGHISFEDTGKLIVSRRLDPDVLQQWHIDQSANVGAFKKEQLPFLEYHRDIILIR